MEHIYDSWKISSILLQSANHFGQWSIPANSTRKIPLPQQHTNDCIRPICFARIGLLRFGAVKSVGRSRHPRMPGRSPLRMYTPQPRSFWKHLFSFYGRPVSSHSPHSALSFAWMPRIRQLSSHILYLFQRDEPGWSPRVCLHHIAHTFRRSQPESNQRQGGDRYDRIDPL